MTNANEGARGSSNRKYVITYALQQDMFICKFWELLSKLVLSDLLGLLGAAEANCKTEWAKSKTRMMT